MFWGLTIEPGKHYSQTVDQSFHVSMAALDTREKSGMTQLLVRHEKAEFLLCTLQYGDGIPYPCLQQALSLNLSEGSEISFYSEGKGTIHLTGYLVTDEPIMEDPDLVAESNSLLVGSDEEEDYDSDEEDDDEEDDEEYSDSDMESTSSQEVSCNWQKLIKEFDEEDDDDSEEEEWTPEAAKKASAKKVGKEKKRKSQDDSMSDDLSLSAYKKKRKAAVQAENLSKMEIAADEGADDDEEDDEEEEDGDFIPNDDFEGEDDESDEDDEEDEDEDEEDDDEEEEEEEEKPKSSPKKKAQTPKGKDVKSPTTSPQKVTKKKEEAELKSQEPTESPLKKKKKKKQKQGEESTEEGELPLKNLKTNNKENIEVQKKEKAVKKEQTPAKPKTPKKIKLQSGTTIEDLKVGEGKLAKPGKKVFMYYRGVLANNQKEFDSQLSGKPFMFGLGKGEVIKGWDAGIIGMKVGGKRRLTVPPSQAYGSQRVGPIPPNSTLVFDVELKSVR